MVGMGVGEEEGVDPLDARADGLESEFRARVDDDGILAFPHQERGAVTPVAGIPGIADRAAASDDGDSMARASPEKGEGHGLVREFCRA
jgi:hypothetical protein